MHHHISVAFDFMTQHAMLQARQLSPPIRMGKYLIKLWAQSVSLLVPSVNPLLALRKNHEPFWSKTHPFFPLHADQDLFLPCAWYCEIIQALISAIKSTGWKKRPNVSAAVRAEGINHALPTAVSCLWNVIAAGVIWWRGPCVPGSDELSAGRLATRRRVSCYRRSRVQRGWSSSRPLTPDPPPHQPSRPTPRPVRPVCLGETSPANVHRICG